MSYRSSSYRSAEEKLHSSHYFSDEPHDEDQDIGTILYKNTPLIQKYYKLYAKDHKDNYKSWSTCNKSILLSNKEYIEIWEWFRNTLMNVELEEGIVLKTLAYHCLANGLFETYAEAARFFEPMNFSHDNLVGSFIELIKTLSIATFPDSVALRTHIKNWQVRRRPSNSGIISPNGNKIFLPEKQSEADAGAIKTVDEDVPKLLSDNDTHPTSDPNLTDPITSDRSSPNEGRSGVNSPEYTSKISRKFVQVTPQPGLVNNHNAAAGQERKVSATHRNKPTSYNMRSFMRHFGGRRVTARISDESICTDKKHYDKVSVSTRRVTNKRKESIISAISGSVRVQLSRITSFADTSK